MSTFKLRVGVDRGFPHIFEKWPSQKDLHWIFIHLLTGSVLISSTTCSVGCSAMVGTGTEKPSTDEGARDMANPEKSTKMRIQTRPKHWELLRLGFNAHRSTSLLLCNALPFRVLERYQCRRKSPVALRELCAWQVRAGMTQTVYWAAVKLRRDSAIAARKHGGIKRAIHQLPVGPSCSAAVPADKERGASHRRVPQPNYRVGTIRAVQWKLTMRSPALMEKPCSSPEQLY